MKIKWQKYNARFDTIPIRSFRLAVQTAFVLFCLYCGLRFYLFYLWAIGASEIYVSRPPAVEGFLPISALLGLKKLICTGQYDIIHPAGLTILMAAFVIALLFRKGFCGWICPVGAVSNVAEMAGKKLKVLFRAPVWIDMPLLSLKYLLLAFFLYIIFWTMNMAQIEAFQFSAYNLAADAKMLFFFLHPSVLAGGVLLFLLTISFFMRNFWCRYLCPYGALLGLFALLSPFQVKRDEKTCIDCKKCEKACPGSIPIAQSKTIYHCECIGCMECVSVCPVTDCLTLQAPKKRTLHPLMIPIAVLVTFFLFWLVALANGYWHSQVPPEMFQNVYSVSEELLHPSMY